MSETFEVVSLFPAGARSLMRELADVLSDEAAMRFVQRFEVTLDQGSKNAEGEEQHCRRQQVGTDRFE